MDLRMRIRLALREVADDLRTEANTASIRAELERNADGGRHWAAFSSAINQHAAILDELANQIEGDAK